MEIKYEKVITATFELDIPALYEKVIANCIEDGTPREELEMFDLECVFGDNVGYFLEEMGLEDDLSSDERNVVYDQVMEEFEKLFDGERVQKV